MADRCSACLAPVLLAVDFRGKPLQLHPEALAVALPLSFRVPERIDGYSRAGDHVAGRMPAPGEEANGSLYLPHHCPRTR